jgi:hypothetical protein
MAHFAKIENGIVTQVIVVANEDCVDSEGVEQESIGVAFCQNLFGGNWKQTSYNANFRKNYAGIEYSYDPQRNAFIPPQPFASWVLNEETCRWEAPVPVPENTDVQDSFSIYVWDEDTLNWVLTTQEQ